jgi:hypothetical protein
MLGARAALIDFDSKNTLPAPITISKIRGLALENTKGEREQLEKYLGLTHIKNNADARESDLHKNLSQIDAWLLFNDTAKDFGLPPVLRASLAQDAPDVFLLLLHLAQKVRNDRLRDNEIVALRRPILGLATALHWFGADRAKAVAALYTTRLCTETLSPESFRGVLKHCLRESDGNLGLLKIHSSAELESLIPKAIFSDEKLSEWRFSNRIIEADPVNSDKRGDREMDTWPFIRKAIGSKALLLYAQRSLLSSQFNDFDPSRIDIHAGKNRPWDYDHILPSSILANNHGRFRDACREWINTIGNFRAWPLEMNRSRQDGPANQYIHPVDFENSILCHEECDAFSLAWADVNIPTKAAAFMNAARSRFLRVYEDWFVSLEIEKLLSDEMQSHVHAPHAR